MEWLAVKNKATGDMYVQSRVEREIMIGALDGVDQINSIVLKTFGTEKDAQDYVDDIDLSNKILDEIL